jgi:hypothetical protein
MKISEELMLLLERSWWAGLKWNLFGKILDSECWRHWFFKWFLPLKIQTIPKKTRFWKEKSIENVVTFAGLPLTLGIEVRETCALVFGSVIRIGTFFFWYFSQFGCLMLSALIFVLCLNGFYCFEFCFAK